MCGFGTTKAYPPAREWSEELGRAIEGAERLIMFVSPNAVASKHCRNELHFAQNHDVPLLAVHLQETTLPVGVELALGSSQAIFGYRMQTNTMRAQVLEALAVTDRGSVEAQSARGAQAAAPCCARFGDRCRCGVGWGCHSNHEKKRQHLMRPNAP